MTTPFFSIVIPTYNRRQLVCRAVDSVLEQSFDRLEILVVDDGSTDGTTDFLKSKYAGNNKVKLLKQVNAERGAARNNGLNSAIGEYVFFMDSDDRLSKEHFSLLYSKIQELGQPNFLCMKFDLENNGTFTPSPVCRLKEGWYDYRILLEGNIFAAYVCVKRANPNLKPFENDRQYAILEDWMFNVQNLRNDRIYVIDRITYHVNDHSGRSMHSDYEVIAQKKLKACDWILRNVPLEKSDQQLLRADAEYFCAVHAYADHASGAARRHLWNAIGLQGLKPKHIVLFFKSLIGKKAIDRLRNK